MILKYIDDKLEDWHKRGIRVPLIQESGTKKGSFVYTMAFVSFNVLLIAMLMNMFIFIYSFVHNMTPLYFNVTELIYWNLSTALMFAGKKINVATPSTNKKEPDENISE